MNKVRPKCKFSSFENSIFFFSPSLASHECQPVDDDSLAPAAPNWLENLLLVNFTIGN